MLASNITLGHILHRKYNQNNNYWSNIEISWLSLPLVLRKALPRVCMGNTARGGVMRDKYSMRRSQVLYLSRDTPKCCISHTDELRQCFM